MEHNRNVYPPLLRGTGRDQQEVRDVDGRMKLKWILHMWDAVDWLRVTQDREYWLAVVNMVMNHLYPKMWGIY